MAEKRKSKTPKAGRRKLAGAAPVTPAATTTTSKRQQQLQQKRRALRATRASGVEEEEEEEEGREIAGGSAEGEGRLRATNRASSSSRRSTVTADDLVAAAIAYASSGTSMMAIRGQRDYREIKGLGRIVKSVDNREFRLHEITGDGNCMFRAISYILWDTESRHRYLRSLVVSHVTDSWRDVKSLVFAEWNIRNVTDYADHMGTNGTFASELECVIATRLNKLNLSIYRRADDYNNNDNGNVKRILYSEFHKRAKVANLLFSGRNECGHYDVLLPLGADR